MNNSSTIIAMKSEDNSSTIINTPWFRNCPKCNKVIYYTKPHYLTQSIKRNKLLCRSCSHSGYPSINKLNLIGQTFGRLKVISSAGNNTSNKPRWNCKCDCGNDYIASQGGLRNGLTFSCGCYRKEKLLKYNNFQNLLSLQRPPYRGIYNILSIRCKRKGLELGITYEDFIKFTEIKTCYYCGGSIEWVKHHTRDKQPSAVNLDRIDSSRGYIQGNCRVCCYRCNVIKNNMTEEEFYNHIQTILNVRSERNRNL
jgi:hypothetical protein